MEDVTLQLPEETLEACNSRVAETEFETVEEYLSFVVREVVTETEMTSSQPVPDTDQLESLGYL